MRNSRSARGGGRSQVWGEASGHLARCNGRSRGTGRTRMHLPAFGETDQRYGKTFPDARVQFGMWMIMLYEDHHRTIRPASNMNSHSFLGQNGLTTASTTIPIISTVG